MPNNFFSEDGDLEDYFVTDYWLIDQYIGDTLWTWGLGTSGQLGNNNTTTRSTPVTTFAGGTNWKQVSAGNNFTTAIKTDGTLWTWGLGTSGQLGNNNTTTRSTPVTTFAGGTNWAQVSSGGLHSAAIKTDGTLWVWGSGANGRLGTNNTANQSIPVTTFAGGTDWKQMTCGNAFASAIKTDGTLWVWGSGASGQLGNNNTIDTSTPITTFAGGTNWKQVTCGNAFASAIKTDGTLWTWGIGGNGRLGNNNTIDTSTPITTFAGGTNWKQVRAGNVSTTAIKTDGTLWTWGLGSFGRLGTNDGSNRSTPVTTSAGGTNWKQVGGGGNYTTAIKTDGTLWVWGNGSSGQLGINDIIDRSTPVTTFAGGTNWKQVSGGYNHISSVKTGIEIDTGTFT